MFRPAEKIVLAKTAAAVVLAKTAVEAILAAAVHPAHLNRVEQK